MAKKMTDEKIHDWINDNIISKCQDGRYIFRGESEKYEVPLSSGLYREAYEAIKTITKDNPIPMEYFSLEMIEKYTVDQTRRHVTGNKNIDVLTDLQHYGGVTGLIDFTYKLHVALFFACELNFNKHGYLYLFQQNEFKKEDDINYENKKKEDILIKPTGKNLRALSQSSVFVHAHSGKLTAKEDNRVEIPCAFKIGILDYINKNYSTHAGTVYNDLHGSIKKQRGDFGAREKIYIGSYYFLQGMMDSDQENYDKSIKYYDKAIKYYDKAIKLDPKYADVYIHRASVAFNKESFDEAIKYSTKAIELGKKSADAYKAIKLDEKSADAYYLRALAKHSAIKAGVENKYSYDAAIADYDEAIKLNEEYTTAYFNRGTCKLDKKDYYDAIDDFTKAIGFLTKAIDLNPILIDAYDRRAYAYDKIGKLESAEEDRKKVEELSKELADALKKTVATN